MKKIEKVIVELIERDYGVTKASNSQYDYVLTIPTFEGSTQPLYLTEDQLRIFLARLNE